MQTASKERIEMGISEIKKFLLEQNYTYKEAMKILEHLCFQYQRKGKNLLNSASIQEVEKQNSIF